jgi:DNA-binding transcriptional MerR regulator
LDLIRINDVVENYSISSRTLRYYEERGLLWSHRPDDKSQRHYDATALERLKQIIILRKLQIPIKDMISIFDSEDTTVLIQAFVDKLESLDTEITALSELRKLVDDFLHKMRGSGVKRISAITLLYEETEKRLVNVEMSEEKIVEENIKGDIGAKISGKTSEKTSEIVGKEISTGIIIGGEKEQITKDKEEITLEKITEVSRNALRLHDVRIIRLPSMRVLTSRLKTGESVELNMDNMQNLFADYGFLPTPGMRDCFIRLMEIDGKVDGYMLIKIPDDYNNKTIYQDEVLEAGLYAVTTSFFEDMDDTTLLLKEWVKSSEEFDLDKEGFEMIEEVMPWDMAMITNKFQQDIFIPIKLKL